MSLAPRRTTFVVMLVAMAGESGSARAGQATCSNPGLPVGAAASSDLLPWRLTASLTTGVLPISSTEEDYDARLVLVESRLSAELALRSWLGIGIALPVRVVDVDVTDHDATPTIHARDETIRGLGDPGLLVHGLRELGNYRLHARLGTSLPLGDIVEEDPHLLGMIGQEHQHIQLGTGSFIPFVAVEAQRRIERVTVAAWALAHLSLYENGEGYHAGDRYSAGLTASSALGLDDWSFGAAAEVHGETAEKWHGIVYEDEGNQGRVDVLAGVSASWRPVDDLALFADVKLPIYSHVVGNQLDYTVVASFGVAGSFDFAPRASWKGADVEALGPPGSAAALEPVPGKITVFDLWASWCAPCRELDAGLADLARRYPDDLAVRKLDVVDNESEAWMRYMDPGSYDLPHVRVVDDQGAVLYEATAPPEVLVREVEALLLK